MAIEKFVPERDEFKSFKYPPWMSKEAINLRDKKVKLWRTFRNSQLYIDKVNYKNISSKSTKLYKKLKYDYELKLASDA